MKGFMIIDHKKNTIVVESDDVTLCELFREGSYNQHQHIRVHRTKKELGDEIQRFLLNPEVKDEKE